MQKPKVLLFDLGGVIVRWVGLDALALLTGLEREEVIERFATSDVFKAYEIGTCSDDEFADELITRFNLDTPREAAKSLWNSWVQECYSHTKETLEALRPHYILACLSNTNALHWEHLKTHIDVNLYFDHSYASHLINSAKPDPQSYMIPLKDMDVSAEHVWFFDDTVENVQAAESVGLTSFHVDRNVGVVPKLKELDLII
ncbi:HAD family hydrolase [Hellea balneolensis]|uniref:HAD family hydrolase n=1 Tax=Hellea balneolensis TaxID=287478 RepID=UPI000413E421|nr:HAD-IA family hydrolase [Hellea balneolensis]